MNFERDEVPLRTKFGKANFCVRPEKEKGKPMLLKIHRRTDVESLSSSLNSDAKRKMCS